MNTIYKLIFSFSVLLLSLQYTNAQTADITEGCVPLVVEFTPPAGLSAHFWNFMDGSAGSSDEISSHQFTSPGVYEVLLKEGTEGNDVGTITITVLPDIDVQIAAEIIDPCNPKIFQFTNNSVVPDGVTVISYKWTFGDGFESTQENPIHSYQNSGIGVKPIGLTLTTDVPGCDNSILLTDLVEVTDLGLSAFFSATPSATCDVPATVFFTHFGESEGVDYSWNFGDGNTSSDPTNTIHQYTEEGIYDVTLTLTKGDCVDTHTRTVSVGAPLADFGFNDTLCINTLTLLTNDTGMNIDYQWTFPESVTVETSDDIREPSVTFNEEGLVTINMVGLVNGDANCIIDTTFQVYIQDPMVTVTMDPEQTCINPSIVQIETTEPYASYVWFGQPGGMSYELTYETPTLRDSFFINIEDTVYIDLVVTTAQGCVAELDDYFIQQLPEAHFIPSVHHGCAPLGVTFQDTSTSFEPILTYTYDYGNGDTQTFTNNDDHNYTFTDPGEYLVTLVIENEAGCIDTSWAVLIEVGEQVMLEYELDQSEICIGDTVTLNAINIDPNIDAFNLSTDDGRSHHCEGESTLMHSFLNNTGMFDIEYTVDYNGCRTTIVDENAITVNGPKADLWYMINCDDPLAVMFSDSSQMATSILWTIEDPSGDVTYTDSDFTHTFPESGDYTVYLEAFNEDTGCPSQIDSVVIFAREVVPMFDLPDNLCDNEEYELDASQSIDVDSTCYKGYTWSFIQNGRPRRVGEKILMHGFSNSGIDIVTLTVEDINGCERSMSDTVDVFTIQPLFEFDKEPICFPTEITFTDLTTSDTTIVDLTYFHGVFGSDNLTEFSDEAINTTSFDFFDFDLEELPIFLGVEDAIGCTDTIQLNVDVYRPLTELTSDPKPICIGGEVEFVATDITDQGSSLDYIWDFGNGQTSTESTVTVEYITSGTYPVTLNLTEQSTGCQNEQRDTIKVTDPPIAAFSGANEGMILGPDDVTCAPGVIDFMNESIENDNPTSYVWIAGAGGNSTLPNPTLTFPIGTHEVTLVALSDYGCADTISTDYTFVGLEGDFEILDTILCRGESITFQLADTSGVSSWSWDFGLGEVFTNVNPITQVFDQNVQGNETIVSLSLQAEGNACEIVVSEPIEFSDPLDIEAPNLFTPNGDGENDFFRLAKRVITDVGVTGYMEFRVFNRWGKLVYDNSNGIEGWDGNINGEPAPAEVYGYYIMPILSDCAKKVGNVPETFQGDVTLIR